MTGYQCEEHNNPPDFFLDVINGYLNSSLKSLGPAAEENGKSFDDRFLNCCASNWTISGQDVVLSKKTFKN